MLHRLAHYEDAGGPESVHPRSYGSASDQSDLVAGFEPVWTFGGNRYFISTAQMTRSLFVSDGADNVVRIAEFHKQLEE